MACAFNLYDLEEEEMIFQLQLQEIQKVTDCPNSFYNLGSKIRDSEEDPEYEVSSRMGGFYVTEHAFDCGKYDRTKTNQQQPKSKNPFGLQVYEDEMKLIPRGPVSDDVDIAVNGLNNNSQILKPRLDLKPVCDSSIKPIGFYPDIRPKYGAFKSDANTEPNYVNPIIKPKYRANTSNNGIMPKYKVCKTDPSIKLGPLVPDDMQVKKTENGEDRPVALATNAVDPDLSCPQTRVKCRNQIKNNKSQSVNNEERRLTFVEELQTKLDHQNNTANALEINCDNNNIRFQSTLAQAENSADKTIGITRNINVEENARIKNMLTKQFEDIPQQLDGLLGKEPLDEWNKTSESVVSIGKSNKTRQPLGLLNEGFNGIGDGRKDVIHKNSLQQSIFAEHVTDTEKDLNDAFGKRGTSKSNKKLNQKGSPNRVFVDGRRTESRSIYCDEPHIPVVNGNSYSEPTGSDSILGQQFNGSGYYPQDLPVGLKFRGFDDMSGQQLNEFKDEPDGISVNVLKNYYQPMGFQDQQPLNKVELEEKSMKINRKSQSVGLDSKLRRPLNEKFERPHDLEVKIITENHENEEANSTNLDSMIRQQFNCVGDEPPSIVFEKNHDFELNGSDYSYEQQLNDVDDEWQHMNFNENNGCDTAGSPIEQPNEIVTGEIVGTVFKPAMIDGFNRSQNAQAASKSNIFNRLSIFGNQNQRGANAILEEQDRRIAQKIQQQVDSESAKEMERQNSIRRRRRSDQLRPGGRYTAKKNGNIPFLWRLGMHQTRSYDDCVPRLSNTAILNQDSSDDKEENIPFDPFQPRPFMPDFRQDPRTRHDLSHFHRLRISRPEHVIGSGNDLDIDALDYEELWDLEERIGDVKIQGMSECEIAVLPQEKIKDTSQLTEKTCAVCMEEYHTDEGIRILCCSHFFHVNCIDNWLKVKADCPVCKADVKPEHGLLP